MSIFLNNQNSEKQSSAYSLSSNTSDKIVDLKNPQIIYKIKLESINNNNLVQLDIEKSEIDIPSSEPHLELSAPPKVDKKSKNFNKVHDLLAHRKN